MAFNTNAVGFYFFIVNIIASVIIFVVSLIPADCGWGYYYGYYGGVLGGSVMTFALSTAVLSVIVNTIWAVLQVNPLCRWSALQFGESIVTSHPGPVVVHQEGNVVTYHQQQGAVVQTCRLIIYRWIICLCLGILYLIAFIYTAVLTARISDYCSPGLWIAGTIFVFLVAAVYFGEICYISKRQALYDGVRVGSNVGGEGANVPSSTSGSASTS